MQIDKDQKATGFIILMLLAGFGFGVYLPNRIEQGQLEDRIAQIENAMSVNEKNAHGLRELRVTVDDMRSTLANASKLIPEQNELASFLRTVDTQLERQKMIEAEKLTDRIVPGRDYNVIPLALRFRGEYGGVFQFVNNLENAERLIRINRLEIKGKPNAPEDPVEVRIELSTFSTPAEGNRS